jgi:hypothetical protein
MDGDAVVLIQAYFDSGNNARKLSLGVYCGLQKLEALCGEEQYSVPTWVPVYR